MGLSSEVLCVNQAACLKPFADKVFQISFEEEPPYSHLKHLLLKELLNTGVSPDR